LLVRVMAGSAPEFAVALPSTRAQCKLLRLADNLARSRTRWISRSFRNVHRVHVFQVLTGTEIADLPARIGDPLFSTKVTLHANAVAGSGWEIRGIDD
jgi:hypothetical protein